MARLSAFFYQNTACECQQDGKNMEILKIAYRIAPYVSQ